MTPTPTPAPRTQDAVLLRPAEAGLGVLGNLCRRCQDWRDRGELLLVTDLATGDTWVVCRPEVHPTCVRAAGNALQTSIALLDPEAARQHDAGGGTR